VGVVLGCVERGRQDRLRGGTGRAGQASAAGVDGGDRLDRAGLNVDGSPLSGGYAGAKRTQGFLASYFQRAANARKLGIRFVAVAPRNLLAGTAIGDAAAAAYGMKTGPLDPDGVAQAILAIAAGEPHPEATQLGLTADGLHTI
jgi:hypothetical protein